LQRGVVVGGDGAVGERQEDEPAAGRERAAVVRVAQVHGLLDRAADGIDRHEVALVALVHLVGAARAGEPALLLLRHVLVVGDVLTSGHGRNVKQLGLGAIGRGPVVVAAGTVGTDFLHRIVGGRVGETGIGLHVLARVVVERLAGLLVDALGPVDVVHIGLGADDLPVVAVHGVDEAVAGGMGGQLWRLAVGLLLDEDGGGGRGVVPHRLV